MRWFVWLVLAGCSSGTGPATRPAAPAGDAPGGDRAAGTRAPSERECDALIEHALELGARERAPRPPDQLPNEHDRQHVRAGLGPLADECRALPRDRYRCAMAATTLAELEACQPTRSSSTSNSSVAPGGITPPAPRSP